MSKRSLVLGAGFVGRAAAWDLQRRGHDVTVADADADVARRVGAEFGLPWRQADVTGDLDELLSAHDNVVSAVPYRFGVEFAAAAVRHGCNYYDFGGNPTIVKAQIEMDRAACEAGVAVVPDCGLAPGVANVIAAGIIDETTDEVQIRVGVLPLHPKGTLEYQLVFYAGGLINEYDEPCEVIADGAVSTVEPLTRFEQFHWDGIGELEAFSTAGGTSTMCQEYKGKLRTLEYKTIRYPGHGRIFAALREIGLFDQAPSDHGGVAVAPRTVLLDLLTANLPSSGADRTLVQVSAHGVDGAVRTRTIVDEADDRFSSLARTTAFPATALCDLIARGDYEFSGAAAMHSVAPPVELLGELEQVAITAKAS